MISNCCNYPLRLKFQDKRTGKIFEKCRCRMDLPMSCGKKTSISLINMYDLTDLMVYCRDGEISKIKKIIDVGQDVNFANKMGLTALMVSCRSIFNTNVIKLLLEYGADPFIKDDKGNSALDFCVSDNSKEIILNSMKMIN